MKNRTGRLSQIRLELVRQRRHPAGDSQRAYELALPLNPDGHIDATSWSDNPSECRIRRIRRGQAEAQGILARAPNGRWYFDYQTGHDNADYQGIGLGDDRFHIGALIGVNEEDGAHRTYQVTLVAPIGVVA